MMLDVQEEVRIEAKVRSARDQTNAKAALMSIQNVQMYTGKVKANKTRKPT